MTSWVHRYTLRGLMDDSLDLFKESAVKLLTVGLLPICLLFIYVTLMRAFYIPGNLLPNDSEDAIFALFKNARFDLYLCGYLLLALILCPLSYLGQLRIVMARVLGETCGFWEAYRRWVKPVFSFFVLVFFFTIFSSIVMAVVTMLVFSVVGGFGAISMASATVSDTAAMIVAVVASALAVVAMTSSLLVSGVLFQASPVALAHEHAGPFAAMSRAFSLAGKNFRAYFSALYVITHIPFGVLLLLAGVGGLCYWVTKGFAPYLSVSIISSLVFMVSSVAFLGVVSCLQVLSYIDGRCRAEAFDLKLLAEEIGLGAEFAQASNTRTPLPAVHYPDYSRAPQQPARPAAPTGYPNYSAPPPAPAAYPDYSAPPPGSEAPTPTAVPMGFPDYSVPPPGETATVTEAASEPDSVPAAPVSAFPDYSAPPPPPREDRDAE